MVRIRIKENSFLELEDMKAINAAKDELAGDSLYTVLFVAPENGGVSSEARAFAATAACYHNAIAKAIIVKSIAPRLIANFFIKVNKPPAPTRVFSNEAAGINWLEFQSN